MSIVSIIRIQLVPGVGDGDGDDGMVYELLKGLTTDALTSFVLTASPNSPDPW